ncbi:hypothetical protein G7068_12120 [Leucobacter viscericola]|uniref:DUF6531 domain-containing protein n=1 Tax=Leucobacter viscericola TaxID=2714935 RepID=A0A6G7XH12_9MICO|nr:DUF6531 domain-containing protein [Leucobacter viscericola]QIK63855.1 hypothetical protein G7068_12120 [Leucobacter viscericola]
MKLQPREPASGGGKRGGGTTSGRPDKLLSFANGVMGSGGQSGGSFGTYVPSSGTGLRGAWNDFVAGLGGWGSVDEGGVIASVQSWRQANRDEGAWVQAFAKNLKQAGGQGSIKSMADRALDLLMQNDSLAPGERAALSLKLPETFGDVPATGYAVDPVNTATGNFIEPETDVSFEGSADTLVFSRMYNSQDEGAGVFGTGWSSSLDARLELSDEDAEGVMFDGRRLVFPREDAGWGRALRANFWLTRERVDAAGEFGHVWCVAGEGAADEALVLRGNQGNGGCLIPQACGWGMARVQARQWRWCGIRFCG